MGVFITVRREMAGMKLLRFDGPCGEQDYTFSCSAFTAMVLSWASRVARSRFSAWM